MAYKWEYAVSFAEHAPLTAPLPLSGDICENLKKAAAMGYAGLEMHTRENVSLEIPKILDCSRQCGARITAIASGRLYTEGKVSLLDDAPYSSQAAMEGMRSYIELAQTFGVGVVVGWAKGNIPVGGDKKLYMERLAGQMRSLNDYAKLKGVPLYIEVINRYEVNFFHTADELCDFLAEYALDNCYVHLDTFHMNIEELDPCQAIRRCGKKLGYFHVADNTRRYPGSGQLDFVRILSALEEVDYRGLITVECFPVPDRDTAAKNAIAHLRACEGS